MGESRRELEDRFLLALRQATGNAEIRLPPDDRETWGYVTSFAGRELRFLFTLPSFSDCVMGASMGGRPVALRFATRHQRVSGLPAIRTGDASFDAMYSAHGVPEEAVAALLDPGLRRWLMDTYDGAEPLIDTSGPYVRLHIPVRRRRGGVLLSDSDVPSPEQLVRWMQALLMVTDGLCRAFDAQHAIVHQTQGPAAAQSWLERARQAKARGVMVREPRVLLVILAVIALLVIAGGAILTGLWWAFGG